MPPGYRVSGLVQWALCRYRHNAHELLHQREKQPDVVKKNGQQRELEAEAIAYVVMRHFGIEHVACNYLATYKIDSAQLTQSLQTISTTAKVLIAAIDPQFRETGETAADAASDPPA